MLNSDPGLVGDVDKKAIKRERERERERGREREREREREILKKKPHTRFNNNHISVVEFGWMHSLKVVQQNFVGFNVVQLF